MRRFSLLILIVCICPSIFVVRCSLNGGPNKTLEEKIKYAIENLDYRSSALIYDNLPTGPSRIYSPEAFDYLDEKNGAALMLIDIGSPAIPTLIKTLQDMSYNRRELVADVLGKIKDKKATLPLIKALQEDPDIDVRIYAAEALGDLGDETAIPALQKELSKYIISDELGSIMITIGILSSLARLGDEKAFQQFQQYIDKKTSDRIRMKALWLLGKIRRKEVFEVLLKYIKGGTVDSFDSMHKLDKDWKVRQRARRELYKLTGESLHPPGRTVGAEYVREKEIAQLWEDWWKENKQFLYWSDKDNLFIVNQEAKQLSIPVDEHTGEWLDPKDGHKLTPEEIERIKHEKTGQSKPK